jgi:hypothetical protein
MEELLWIKEEDEIMKQICKTKDIKNPKFDLLVRYKGRDAVERRVSWLGLSL